MSTESEKRPGPALHINNGTRVERLEFSRVQHSFCQRENRALTVERVSTTHAGKRHRASAFGHRARACFLFASFRAGAAARARASCKKGNSK